MMKEDDPKEPVSAKGAHPSRGCTCTAADRWALWKRVFRRSPEMARLVLQVIEERKAGVHR